MKKTVRMIALILSHVGLVVSALFLIFFMIGAFVPEAASFARLDFFAFDYFYLIIPLLCIVSGILLQIAANRIKRKPTAKPMRQTKD